jgi:hypothetical protein
MNEAILIIQLLFNNQPINYVHHVTRHGSLNYQVCLDLRERHRKLWAARDNVTIVYIDCPNHWSET